MNNLPLSLLDLLAGRATFRLNQYAGRVPLIDPPPPTPDYKSITDKSPLGTFIRDHKLSADELLVLTLALVPHLDPAFFVRVVNEVFPEGANLPLLGGVKGQQHQGLIPTGETALFMLAGTDLSQRLVAQRLFLSTHLFACRAMLRLEDVPTGEPPMSGRVVLSAEFAELFTTGETVRPHFSSTFPARLIETTLDWADLILSEDVRQQVDEVKAWVRFGPALRQQPELSKRLRPGYRVLFHGPPGTGKTLTAGLLGKYAECDVYRIDLSAVVSKYIGDTEKNLSNLFARAENKQWILFFDEADALFSKRTGVRDAHDKYANQEVSYLLQRIEQFAGLVILASNLKSNIDEAFLRRFDSIVKFSMPAEPERRAIWTRTLPGSNPPPKPKTNVPLLTSDPDLPTLAARYELSGGNILNVVQYVSLKALTSGSPVITADLLTRGIQREYHKEGKVFQR